MKKTKVGTKKAGKKKKALTTFDEGEAQVETKVDQKLAHCEKAVRKFAEWVTKNSSLGGIEEWYPKLLESAKPPKQDEALSEANKLKNRNTDYICFDATRVKLQEVAKEEDYINANYISTENVEKGYIITQHPLETTTEHFWRMVFYENVDAIVNISGPEENLPVYFPTEAGKFQNCGIFFINNRKVVQPSLEFSPVAYTIEVLPEGCSNSRIVTVLQFDGWAKNRIPTSPRLINRIKRLIKVDKTTRGPIVVHCASGINRAGSYIIASILEDQIFRNHETDISAFMKSLREQRGQFAQNKLMFLYAINSVADYIRLRCKRSGMFPEVVKDMETFQRSIDKDMIPLPVREPPAMRRKAEATIIDD